jgi:ATP-dependent DNA helicase RecQ
MHERLMQEPLNVGAPESELALAMAGRELARMDFGQALKRLGYEAFRPGQREAIELLLLRRRLLLVAPTGGGKSLTYQLPASLLPGTTVVVSPLISLMNDQVMALGARGVNATYLASTLSSEEARERLSRARQGAYKMLYVAPERLSFPGFRAVLRDLDCPLVVVDEAHCVSAWGHDFRPEYLQIRTLVEALPQARVLACTATATPVVRDEILSLLGLGSDTPQLVRGFARPNLVLRAEEVSSAKERHKACDQLLNEVLGGPGKKRGTAIVYAPTRKKAEAEAERLGKRGFRVAAYHAGLASQERLRAQERFSSGTLEIVVATNAFGMGIDRGDVRAVVHLAPPGSVEAYYQEVGRAGRDGEIAYGLLLASHDDMAFRRRLIESDSSGATKDPALVEHQWNLFLELMRWTEGGSCRHDAILRYFGTEDIADGGCGRCDVCRRLGASDGRAPELVQLVVRKALSGVARIHGRFGLGMAAKLLRGQTDERLSRAGLEKVSTFGILSEYDERWVLSLLRRCVTAGWVNFTPDERPRALLTAEGGLVMKGESPARLVLPRSAAAAASGAQEPGQRRAERESSDELTREEQMLFELLRAHRLEVARQEKVPPYVVASDRTLRDLAQKRPRDEHELQHVHGIGPGKAARYGAGLLTVIRKGR